MSQSNESNKANESNKSNKEEQNKVIERSETLQEIINYIKIKHPHITIIEAPNNVSYIQYVNYRALVIKKPNLMIIMHVKKTDPMYKKLPGNYNLLYGKYSFGTDLFSSDEIDWMVNGFEMDQCSKCKKINISTLCCEHCHKYLCEDCSILVKFNKSKKSRKYACPTCNRNITAAICKIPPKN